MAGVGDATNAGNNSIVVLSGTADGAVVDAGSLTITGASDLAQLLDNSTATITSAATGANVWSPDSTVSNTVTDGGVGDHVSLGDRSNLTITGTSNTDSVGSWSTTFVDNHDDIVTEGTGSYAALQGGNDTGFANGTGNFNLAGVGEVAHVADGSYVGVVSGSDDIAYVNNGVVTTLNNVGVTVIGSGNQVNGGSDSTYTVVGDNGALTVGQGTTGFVNGTNDILAENGPGDRFNVANSGAGTDTVNLAGTNGDYVGLLGGAGYVVNGDNASIGTWDDTHFAVTGNNDTVDTDWAVDGSSTAGSSGVVTGTGDVLDENGNSDSFSVIDNGAGTDQINEYGANDSSNEQNSATGLISTELYGLNDYAGLLGKAGYIVTGSDATINTWSNTSFTVLGNYDTIGTDCAPDGALVAGSNADVHGMANTISIGASDSLGVSGGGNTINIAGADTTVFLTQTNGSADTVDGSGDSSMGVATDGQNAGIFLDSNTQADVHGSGNAITVSSGDSLGVGGGGANVISDVGADDTVFLTQTNGAADSVYGSGVSSTGTAANGQQAGIFLGASTQADVHGNANTVVVNNGDSLGIAGGANVVENAGADDVVFLTQTNGAADSVYGSGISSTGTAANGQQAGIFLDTNTQADVHGSSNTVVVNNGDSLGIAGGANAVENAGADDTVFLTQTNGAADSVYGSGVSSAGMAANGQQAGIFLDTNTQADVHGSSNDITINTGDSLGVGSGGNDTIDNIGTSDTVFLTQTGGDADTVNGSDDNALGVAANGQEAGIFTGPSTDVSLNGDRNQVTLANGSTAIVNGAGNLVDLDGSGFVQLNGPGNVTMSGGDALPLDGLAFSLFGLGTGTVTPDASSSVSPDQLLDLSSTTQPSFDTSALSDAADTSLSVNGAYSGTYDILDSVGQAGLIEGEVSGAVSSSDVQAIKDGLSLLKDVPVAVADPNKGRVSPVDSLYVRGSLYPDTDKQEFFGTPAQLVADLGALASYAQYQVRQSNMSFQDWPFYLEFPGGAYERMTLSQIEQYALRSEGSLYNGDINGDLNSLFTSLLGRAPSAQDYGFYGTSLYDTGSDTAVRHILAASSEALNELSVSFTNVLGLAAPSAYLVTVQQEYLENGGSQQGAEAAFANAPLTAELIEAASQGITGVTLDTTGLQNEQLALGSGADTMLGYRTALADSVAGANQITITAENIFGVVPDSSYIGAIQAWEIAGGDTQVEIQALANSGLSQTLIAHDYLTVLGRAATPSDISNDVMLLENGESEQDLIYTLAYSPEASLYQSNLLLVNALQSPNSQTSLDAYRAGTASRPDGTGLTISQDPNLHMNGATLLDDMGNPIVGASGVVATTPQAFSPDFFVQRGIEDAALYKGAVLAWTLNSPPGGSGLPLTDPNGIPMPGSNRLAQFVIEQSLVGSPLGNFGQGHVWDAQRFGDFADTNTFRDAATIYIGLYMATAGIPRDMGEQIQNDYATLFSKFNGQIMSKEFTSLPERNVTNFDIGYNLFLDGKLH